MKNTPAYLLPDQAPTATTLAALPGLTLLEFGTEWCGHCRAAQAAITQALATPTPGQIQHFKIEDGPGRALGRSYRVKLWPTLILLRDGQEIGRLVRPTATQDVAAMLGAAR